MFIFQALAKAQEASAMERQLIRMQEQANVGDTHNLDLTFAVSPIMFSFPVQEPREPCCQMSHF